MLCCIDGNIALAVGVGDEIRPEGRQFVAEMRSRGIGVSLVSGDAQATTRFIAR